MAHILILQRRGACQARFQITHLGSSTSKQNGTAQDIPAWQTVLWHCALLSQPVTWSCSEDVENTRFFVETPTGEHEVLDKSVFGSTAAVCFLVDVLLAASGSTAGATLALVLPASAGYIVRSDLLSLRLLGTPMVSRTASFPQPQQFFSGEQVQVPGAHSLAGTFAAALGGLLLDAKDKPSAAALLPALDSELENRLAFPWLTPTAPGRKTLAIVDGGITGPDTGGTGESIYAAAAALGIDMVVLDTPSHWVNTPRFSHWRKATVPLDTDLQPKPGYSGRIVSAVRAYQGHVDGILTMRDHYKYPVAQAALELGLPTYSPAAYDIATDKFKTSRSEGHHAHLASSVEQATALVQEHSLEFPLIIKPTNGFLSEGVFRVEDLASFEAGIRGIDNARHGHEFVIEKYCQGPELDVNVVLVDGDLVFYEASDDFPKGADANGQAAAVKSFIELANVLPSAIPTAEHDMLRAALRESLLRMGFMDGFYHLEARVENSSWGYATTASGLLDLAPLDSKASSPASSWLIEVNPRPPGIQASDAVKHTYGIDYFGLALLFAIDDKDRVRRLVHAYAQGPQYWCNMVFIPVATGGTYESGDVCAELFSRRPDLEACVSSCFCFLKRGAAVADPGDGINSWVAYFNVFSRVGREDVLRLGEEVRREVRFTISGGK